MYMVSGIPLKGQLKHNWNIQERKATGRRHRTSVQWNNRKIPKSLQRHEYLGTGDL